MAMVIYPFSFFYFIICRIPITYVHYRYSFDQHLLDNKTSLKYYWTGTNVE
jgi:hypothetical protein